MTEINPNINHHFTIGDLTTLALFMDFLETLDVFYRIEKGIKKNEVIWEVFTSEPIDVTSLVENPPEPSPFD